MAVNLQILEIIPAGKNIRISKGYVSYIWKLDAPERRDSEASRAQPEWQAGDSRG